MKFVLLLFVRAYQLVLSPFFGTHCRFQPSCSCYAQDALKTHGALQGSLLILRRLLRCHPFTKAGFDPVPKQIALFTHLAVASEVEDALARRTASVHLSTCGFEHQSNALIHRHS